MPMPSEGGGGALAMAVRRVEEERTDSERMRTADLVDSSLLRWRRAVLLVCLYLAQVADLLVVRASSASSPCPPSSPPCLRNELSSSARTRLGLPESGI